jgi:hypothetical protein
MIRDLMIGGASVGLDVLQRVAGHGHDLRHAGAGNRQANHRRISQIVKCNKPYPLIARAIRMREAAAILNAKAYRSKTVRSAGLVIDFRSMFTWDNLPNLC